MKLSIIIPCYNEHATILKVIEHVARLDIPVEKEIIVVNDGSDDGTTELLKELSWSPEFPVSTIAHAENMGKGDAVATGVLEAKGDFLIVQDADIELSPDEYPALLQPIINGQTQVVFGSRRRKGYPKMYFHTYLGNCIVNLFTNLLFAAKLSDVSCGYKILPVALYRQLNLKCRGFDFCAEITAKLLINKIKIVEIPVDYTPRTYAQGKKIHWKDGLIALKTLMVNRFSPANRQMNFKTHLK